MRRPSWRRRLDLHAIEPVRLDPGELEVLLLNTDREEACELRAGDRIAQLVVDPCAPAEPVELELVSHRVLFTPARS